MKLLVFAHTPPPYHGQSYMVQLVLEGLGGDVRQRLGAGGEAGQGILGQANGIECYHVNCRLSEDVADIGRPRWKKLWRLLGYCGEAVWCRWRYGVTHFYYVPAPALRTAVYRDWLVMILCRPFFRKLIFHWHAAGLGDWLATQARPWERGLSRWLLGRPALSLVLGEYQRTDGVRLDSARIEILPYGVPDPCPEYAEEIRPRRRARAAVRRKLLAGEPMSPGDVPGAGNDAHVFRVLFLSLCYHEKGLFDAVDAVGIANGHLQESRVPLRIQLSVAGKFYQAADQARFEQRLAGADLWIDGEPLVRYHGFVTGESKRRLFVESDCFCFPTYYSAESFGVVLIEAMAFGLPCVTTNWRHIPELFPAGYAGIVEPRSPKQIAQALETFSGCDHDDTLRQRFENHYTLSRFIGKMKMILQTL
ncbi:MAG: glycosyltransferase family 4 protein [Limisphaerales bacterium]